MIYVYYNIRTSHPYQARLKYPPQSNDMEKGEIFF